jgi:hypothetical protein
VRRRSTSGAETSRSATGRAAARERRLAEPAAGADSRLVSTSVFHSPQPEQRPDHDSASCPHDWQTYVELARAT